MFTGSGHVPYGMHDKLTEGVGGNNNGSTTNDRTNYFENIPSNYLESTLWMEADRMGFLLDTLDLTKINAQRDIVKNERRQSYDNQPYGRVIEIFSAAMYPKGHPYSWPVIGSMTDLSAASEEDVKAFFRLFSSQQLDDCYCRRFRSGTGQGLITKYRRLAAGKNS
jgi:zinc protease